jgi:SAM-dependent methyltransferase
LIDTYEWPALREALGDVLRPGGLALTDEALAACMLPPGARVADVGCGEGATVRRLGENHKLLAAGVDISPVLLAAARQREPALPLVRARAARLPIVGDAFDAVLAECTLSTMPDVGFALAEFRRILKPGGRLVLSDLYARGEDAAPSAHKSCFGPRTRGQMEAELAGHGFELVKWCDRSDTSKVLAARLILAGMPPASLWDSACGALGGAAPGSLDGRKPGYFWLIASKRASS